jgi:prophage regulatory protein
MNDVMLRPREAAKRLGITKTCLYNWVRAGKLPPPIKLSSRTSVWRASVLDAFVAQREAQGGAA